MKLNTSFKKFKQLHKKKCSQAIHLSFKCNKGGFNIGHFLAALFFAPFYVIYQFANNFEDCK